MINTEKNLKFRKLFDSSTIVQIPVIYDAFSELFTCNAKKKITPSIHFIFK